MLHQVKSLYRLTYLLVFKECTHLLFSCTTFSACFILFSESFVCPENYVQCRKGYCIPVYKICDSYQDCQFGEDEVACGMYKCCYS